MPTKVSGLAIVLLLMLSSVPMALAADGAPYASGQGGGIARLQPAAASNMNNPSITTVLSSSTITAGGSVTDSATLEGAAGNAMDTVTFYNYTSWSSGGSCPGTRTQVGLPVSFTVGSTPVTVTSSTSQQFNSTGSYGWEAFYSGDANNIPTHSLCELLTVNKASPTIVTTLNVPSGIIAGQSASDSATLTGASPTAGGSVTYYYFSNSNCTGTATILVSAVTSGSVTNGIVPPSSSQPFVPAGSYSLIANYSGDANNNPATSKCEPLTVNKVSPTITQVLSNTAIMVGQSVTDSATLIGGYEAADTVTYYYYSSKTCTGTSHTIGSVPVTPVTVTTSVAQELKILASKEFPSAGSYYLAAVYSGDPSNNGVPSKCEQLTVKEASPSITITPSSLSLTDIVAGQSVTDSATLKGGFQPTGTVTFYYYFDNTCTPAPMPNPIGLPVPLTKQAWTKQGEVLRSVPQNFPNVGPSSLQAVYNGDDNNSVVKSPCQFLAVNKPGVSISTTALSPVSPVAPGVSVSDSATLSGTVGSAGGTVKFEYFSGSYCSGSGTIVGSLVSVTGGVVTSSSAPQTFKSPGNYSWNAVYSGDASTSNNGATSPCEPLEVSGFATTTLSVSCPPVIVGSPTTCKATVQRTVLSSLHGSTPTGPVTWSTSFPGKFSSPTSTCPLSRHSSGSSTCTVRFTPASAGPSVNITASYAGDTSNSQSTGTFALTVTSKTSKTTVSCTPASVPANSSTVVKCKATVKGYKPTGDVNWIENPPPIQSSAGLATFTPTCKVTLASKGSCTVILTGVQPGGVLLNATYGGDANNTASSLRKLSGFTVGKALTTVKITCSSTTLSVGVAMQCTATVQSAYYPQTGTVTWSKVSGAPGVTFSPTTCHLLAESCSVTVTASATGTLTIEATYNGDRDNLPSPSTLQPLTVGT